MTPAQSILAELAGLGVSIHAHGDKLRVCPASAVPAELRDRIRAYRAELLVMLARVDAPRAHVPAGWCGPPPTLYDVDGQKMTFVQRAAHWRKAGEATNRAEQ